MTDTQSNSITFELGQAILRLNKGLRFQVQNGKHEIWYLIEDTLRGTFFRVGEPEYALLSQFDGRRTLATAMARCSSSTPESALGEQETIRLVSWLVESGLASTSQAGSAQQVDRIATQERKQKWLQWVNPICIRIPLGNPDAIFSAIYRFAGWTVGPVGAILGVLICTWAVLQLASHWQVWSQQAVSCFSRDSVLMLAASWCLLKLLHECGHGLVCKRFGGQVRGCGVMFFLLIPLPYVDLSSAWRFPSRYQRMLTSAAGMIVELLIAALAVLVWLDSEPGLLQTITASIAVTASVHTLVFNANPLMRFDGYHILADWLEFPNLAQHGSQSVASFFRFLFTGERATANGSGRRELIAVIYGWLAAIWKIVVCMGILIAASNLLEGSGLLLALAAVVLWWLLPIAQFFYQTLVAAKISLRQRLDRILRLSAFGFVMTGFLFFLDQLPAPPVLQAPLVIDFSEEQQVRVATQGFVDQVHVAAGQQVEAGDLLVTLSNEPLRVEFARLQCEAEQARVRKRIRQSEDKIALAQMQEEKLIGFLAQLKELEADLEQLSIRATRSGRVLGNDLESLLGNFCETGQTLFYVADEVDMQATAMLSQNDLVHLQSPPGKEVELTIWGQGSIPGKVDRVSPSSTDSLPHFALAGNCGGPLAVQDRIRSEGQQPATELGKDNWKLVQPRMQVNISLAASDAAKLHAGQTGLLLARGRNASLRDFLSRRLWSWVAARIERTHGL